MSVRGFEKTQPDLDPPETFVVTTDGLVDVGDVLAQAGHVRPDGLELALQARLRPATQATTKIAKPPSDRATPTQAVEVQP